MGFCAIKLWIWLVLHEKKTIDKLINKIPPIGILIFLVLYIYSSTLYPGGSQANLHSEGFDWLNNYWCNLMNKKGMNGQLNPARPFAITAMIILCLSLMVFFIQFANVFIKQGYWRRIVKIGGVLSMVSAILMFTEYHDLMTMISSFFGLFVVVGIIRVVYRSKLTIYKITGIACLLLLGLNNYIYYSTHFLEWLLLIQKITLLLVLLWIMGLHFIVDKS